MRQETMRILQQESELKEIARLVGVDALSNRDRLVLGTAKAIREDFLHQNAVDDVDTYTSFPKQYRMLRNIIAMNRHARDAVEQGVPPEAVFGLPVNEEISRSRYVPEADLDELDAIAGRIETQIRGLVEERGGVNEVSQ